MRFPDPVLLSIHDHPVVLLLVAGLGACIGSFLNVVIYRLPLGLKVHEPSRSFCPACEKTIPWHQNLPVVSWILLRGKCAACGARISSRYVVVEVVTTLLFIAVWLQFAAFGWACVLALWVLVSLLVSATWIDFEHYIIPDSINWGGVAAGIVFALIAPLMDLAIPSWQAIQETAPVRFPIQESPWWKAPLTALLGAVCGYGLIWAVVQLGKLAFGRKEHRFNEPLEWRIHEPDPDAEPQLEIGGDVYPWSELFSRPSDRLIIEGESITVDGTAQGIEGPVEFYFDRMIVSAKTVPLADVQRLEGRTQRIVQPREAMGFGDVKFVAMIGAFLGWQATLFTLVAGALAGAVGGILQKAVGGEKWSKPIPFGPFLAAGALIFLFAGPGLIRWYLGLAGVS